MGFTETHSRTDQITGKIKTRNDLMRFSLEGITPTVYLNLLRLPNSSEGSEKLGPKEELSI